MQHSPSVQCSETGQQCHHTLVLTVAAAACELLSESRTSGNHISSSQYSSVLSREYWSAGPIFSLENMVRLCKNWSGLKDARFTSSFLNRTQHDSSSTKGSFGNSQRTLEKS